MNTIEQFNEHVMQTYGRIGLVMESGHGQTAVGEDGKEYIDFGSGIGTNSLGYCDEDWVNAVCEQAHKIQHTSNYYYTKVQADFAKRLCEATGYEKMFFGNSVQRLTSALSSLQENTALTNTARTLREISSSPL